MLGYVGKKVDGSYTPFHWKDTLLSQDIEISDDVFLIQRDLAEAGMPKQDWLKRRSAPRVAASEPCLAESTQESVAPSAHFPTATTFPITSSRVGCPV